MSEDKKLCEEMVRQEMEFLRSNPLSIPQEFVALEDPTSWPDGERIMVSIAIGTRGKLTKRNAREAAAAWREAVQRYPKGQLVITLLGYVADPREIWQIADAARYVRWWARHAGMDNEAAVLRAGEINMITATNYGLLGACGVFGEEIKAKLIQDYKQKHGTVVAS